MCRSGVAALAASIVFLGATGPGAAQMARPGMLPARSARPIHDPLTSAEMRSDATLRDVVFIDRRRGWAVGDRGTIWHTADGGQHWALQRSGVDCRLESVWFLDAERGWAVGGRVHPYTHTSAGVVLFTHDGGGTWEQVRKPLVPTLGRVRMFDERRGFAVGAISAMYPSGVFFTRSGGRTWEPLPGERTPGWLGGDFLDPLNGAACGRVGAVGVIRHGGIAPAQTPGLGLRALRRIELVPPVHGWMVGDGGLVMRTDDLGASWQSPPGELPPGTLQQFDFHALAVRGARVWVAGSPGTEVLHTENAGRTWTALDTGQTAPIRQLYFIDEAHGWAVGALGTILATDDGGRTWRRQRCGGTRAAVLGVFGDPKRVPLELFAKLSGDEGYLGVVDVVGRRDLEIPQPTRAHPSERTDRALVAVGACGAETAWRFPLRQDGIDLDPERIVDAWDRANDGRGLDRLEAHLVRQIRTWRPEIVVTHDASPRGGDPLGHVINQAVLQAVERAADATAHVDQLTQGGLRPWPVKRVFAAAGQGGGEIELATVQLAPRLRRSLADAATEPRGLLQTRFEPSPDLVTFRLLTDRLTQSRRARGFFDGIVLQPGGEARRLLPEAPAEGADLLQRVAQRRRNMEAILERTGDDPRSGAGLLAQAGQLTDGLDPDGAAQVLFQLGQRYYRSGQWPLAAEAFELLLQRYPDHPTAQPAQIWLVQYFASGEASWRVHGRNRRTNVQVSTMAIDDQVLAERPQRAAAFGRSIEETDPALYREPAVRFPLCAADRARGFAKDAERFLLYQRRSGARDAWWACAQAELWLEQPEGEPPKPVVFCAPASAKPHLDGRLDEPFWQRARPAALSSPRGDDAAWPAEVRLGYDDAFLYLGLRCRRAQGVAYEETPGPRTRDVDLGRHDRVEVLLDTDRDYATWWKLVIDHRGWTGESCWGDKTWDPKWFVAAGGDADWWTAEAAIPLDQLTGRYPKSPTAWGLGLQRIVPGAGFQSFSQPASTSVIPEGFGLLVFD